MCSLAVSADYYQSFSFLAYKLKLMPFYSETMAIMVKVMKIKNTKIRETSLAFNIIDNNKMFVIMALALNIILSHLQIKNYLILVSSLSSSPPSSLKLAAFFIVFQNNYTINKFESNAARIYAHRFN